MCKDVLGIKLNINQGEFAEKYDLNVNLLHGIIECKNFHNKMDPTLILNNKHLLF